MSLQPYYEDSFKSQNNQSLASMAIEAIQSSRALANYVLESKARFLPNLDWSTIKVAEMGSGQGGLGIHLARLGAEVTLIDFSPSALEQAKKIYEQEGLTAKTFQADVTHPDVILNDQYDLIVDSHLLHCLILDPERLTYLNLVKEHLKNDGIFVAETMVHRKKISVPEGFMLDQNYILWQRFGEWKAVRRILDSLDLEAEIQKSGLNIIYFYYYGQMGIVPHQSFMDIPSEILPAAVRMVLQKK